MSAEVKPIEVLLIEDNLADIELARESLSDAKLLVNLSVVRDGQAALDYLFGRQHQVRPDLIILDWNLPIIKGDEVLRQIKSDEQLKCIPVAVLTSSKAHEDVLKSYSLHANCYITKPLDFDQFEKIIQTLEDFWFSVVTLPSKSFGKN